MLFRSKLKVVSMQEWYRPLPIKESMLFRLIAIIGKQFDLGYMSNWALEFTAGVGLRNKNVQRDNTPANSAIVPKDLGFGETPNYLDNHTSFYFPIGVRVMVRL